MIALVQKGKNKVRNATKRWICEHVKDWLIDDATLGPKALQKKLKEHHGININSKRVYMGPPKKRTKTTKSAQSSIVPCEDDAPAASMCFPPSQSLETMHSSQHHKILEKTSKGKGKGSKSGSGGAKRSRIQPVAVKVHAKRKSKEVAEKIPHLPTALLDSPAMGTRSKKINPPNPAMSTRSKRRLSL